jgi:branched-chain amino acid transport system permease protein
MNVLKATARAVGPWLAVVVVIALLPHLFSEYWVFNFTLVLVYGIAAIGYNVLLGNAGQVSLAPAAFFAIGAYALTIASHRGVPLIVGAVVGVAVSVALSILLGLITLRLSGFYLALSTLSLATLVQQLAGSQTNITGGWGGTTAPAITWFHVGHGKIVDGFYTAAVPLIIVAILTRNLLRSYFGRALAAVRDADLAAGCSGINPLRYRLMAFVISGAYAALAGCFYVGLIGYIDPGQFGLSLTVSMVGMVILGGLGSVVGAVVGSAFFVITPQLLQVAKSTQIVAFGVAIMLAMVLLPGGLMSLVDRGWAALRPRRGRQQPPVSPLTGRADDVGAVESPLAVGNRGGAP